MSIGAYSHYCVQYRIRKKFTGSISESRPVSMDELPRSWSAEWLCSYTESPRVETVKWNPSLSVGFQVYERSMSMSEHGDLYSLKACLQLAWKVKSNQNRTSKGCKVPWASLCAWRCLHPRLRTNKSDVSHITTTLANRQRCWISISESRFSSWTLLSRLNDSKLEERGLWSTIDVSLDHRFLSSQLFPH